MQLWCVKSWRSSSLISCQYGETEIKQYISLLFVKSKSSRNDADLDTELNDSIVDDDIVECVNWVKLLKTIVEVNPTDKQEITYQNLLFSIEESQRNQLPPKGVVKKGLLLSSQPFAEGWFGPLCNRRCETKNYWI